jgi:rare lipoprotein A
MRIAYICTATLLLGSSLAQAETGLASYYHGIGKRGEMTCAHRTRPFGSRLRVSHGNATIDVSISAARALGMMGAGVVRVVVE